jgi:glutamate-ammonia-ligase adenylyltransferase
LVSQFDAFHHYLHENAWTWEHQALVRARMVVGPDSLANSFEQLRNDVICLSRDMSTLRQDILTMRNKIQENARKLNKNYLKMTRGGLADIEFIIQYAILRHAREHPELLNERNSIKILQKLSDYQIIAEADAILLTTAHEHYQQLIRRKILQPEYEFLADPLDHYLQAVVKVWEKTFQ